MVDRYSSRTSESVVTTKATRRPSGCIWGSLTERIRRRSSGTIGRPAGWVMGALCPAARVDHAAADGSLPSAPAPVAQRSRDENAAPPDLIGGPRERSIRTTFGPGSLGRDGLDLAAALVVRLDRLLQVPVLGAREEAEFVEARQVLLGLRQVVQREIGLADVLVGPAVLGIDGEGLLVD